MDLRVVAIDLLEQLVHGIESLVALALFAEHGAALGDFLCKFGAEDSFFLDLFVPDHEARGLGTHHDLEVEQLSLLWLC